MNGFLSNGFLLQLVPALIGAFVGAPLIARELESGTFRFAWTQGLGRRRWTLAKVVGLGVVVTAAAGAISVLFSWYYQPYFPAVSHALYDSSSSPTATSSPFAPGLFDLRGVTFAAWTLAAFAIGAFAGVLIRRVVPAIVATLVAYAGLAFAAGGFLRQHYLAPLVTNKLNILDSAWVLNQQWFTKSGQPASQAVLSQVLQAGAPAQFAGKGGVPKSVDSWRYLVQHGFTQLTTYQPASRFWSFQWIEGGWLLALSVLLIASTMWLVRRRAT
jgi:ABC-type transport system involved in multi-copper enzyme maturation permease subunit